MSADRGVLLYGPPAAGKDTVTAELVANTQGSYAHF
jgi:ATP-dependent 26S proteasome regulatory subunit